MVQDHSTRSTVGSRILQLLVIDVVTFLRSYVRSELSTESELVADSENEEISNEFLALSPEEVNALTDHTDATGCTELQQAIDWTIKS